MSNCENLPNGLVCPSNPSSWEHCKPWELVNDKAQCFMDQIAGEQLNIAGAKVNVYKLLGVHEQTKLTDLSGFGSPISGGDSPQRPATFAFDTTRTEWRSKQTGADAIKASAYIGYDFGEIKISNGRNRYGIEASVHKHISTIKIKQSSVESKRATKVRIERSTNGVEWYGVAVITLPNDDALNTVHFKNSVPSRYWRLRPIELTSTACDSWGIQALELHDYTITRLDNIQDKVFMENRNRDYNPEPILLKGYYDLVSVSTDLSKFGIEIPTSQYNIKIHFNSCVALLGRPIVVGDIIELPSETQYTPDLKPIKRWLEVTEVTWDSGSYTPGWQPTMLFVTTQPALASEETQDIFGDLAKRTDTSGLFDNDDGNHPLWQDYSAVDQAIASEAITAVPERGSEGSNTIREFTEDELQQAADAGFTHLSRIGFNRTGLYVEDAIPQNGAPYTEGPVFPTSPSNGDYHRLTYTGLAKQVPARLHRWSTTKGRWVFLETDRREQYTNQKAILEEYLSSSTSTPAKDIK